MSLAEFSLIERIRTRTRARADVVLGIGDDAALLQPRAGEQLVVTADTLNSGVHFPAETPPYDIGWKTLAVNLSDLASMGARPAWCVLALSLPDADPEWVDAFADGFFALADAHDIVLIGGDTTRGPLSLSVTAMGQVAPGTALRRDGARVGDDVWVSGTLGDAAVALRAWQGGTLDVRRTSDDAQVDFLRQRLARPTPRVALGCALAGVAHAAVDISDGLLADLGHICERSGVGAELDPERLPVSPAARARVGQSHAREAALRGGDDYELCFTAAPAQRTAIDALATRLALPLTRIGEIVPGHAVSTGSDATGPRGYEHFTEL
ncbi:thiamine-phosphate kinase [Stenotrophomonas bentonitica]